MIAGSFKFGTVVGVSAVDLIRALGNDRAYEEASSAVLGFIGKISAYNSLKKSSIAANKYSGGSLTNCPLRKESRLVLK